MPITLTNYQYDLIILLLLLGTSLSLFGMVYYRIRKRPALSDEPAADFRDKELLTTWPHLLRVELLAALIVLLLLLWAGMFFTIPIGAPFNPKYPPAYSTAPWFMLPLQELLRHFEPWMGGIFLPGLLIFALIILPFLFKRSPKTGDYRASHFYPMRGFILAGLLLFGIPTLVAFFLRDSRGVFLLDFSPFSAVHLGRARRLGELFGISNQRSILVESAFMLGPYLLWAGYYFLPIFKDRRETRSFGRHLLFGFFWAVGIYALLKWSLATFANIPYLWITPWFKI